jgi:hypothetical protein
MKSKSRHLACSTVLCDMPASVHGYCGVILRVWSHLGEWGMHYSEHSLVRSALAQSRVVIRIGEDLL